MLLSSSHYTALVSIQCGDTKRNGLSTKASQHGTLQCSLTSKSRVLDWNQFPALQKLFLHFVSSCLILTGQRSVNQLCCMCEFITEFITGHLRVQPAHCFWNAMKCTGCHHKFDFFFSGKIILKHWGNSNLWIQKFPQVVKSKLDSE